MLNKRSVTAGSAALRAQLAEVFRGKVGAATEPFDSPIDPGDQKKVERKLRTLAKGITESSDSLLADALDKDMGLEVRAVNTALKGAGSTQFSAERLQEIKAQVEAKLSEPFFGKTRAQRFGVSERMMSGRLQNEVRSASGKELTDAAKGRVSDYLDPNKANTGWSPFKWNERLVTSEYHRAMQMTGRVTAKEAGLLVRWVLDPSHKRHDICDEYANGTGDDASDLLDELEDAGGRVPKGREGIYTPDEAPDYPHPFCRCRLVPVAVRFRPMDVNEDEVFDKDGEELEDFGDVFYSPESEDFAEDVLAAQFKETPKWDEPVRTKEEVDAYRDKLEKTMTKGLEEGYRVKSSPLEKYIARGGERAYEELAKNTVGAFMDPEMVKSIGVDSAMKLLAWDIRHSPNSAEVISGLERYIKESIPGVLRVAKSTAEVHFANAGELRRQVDGGMSRRAVASIRAKEIAAGRQEIGDALGYAELHNRLLKELTSGKALEFVPIKFGSKEAMADVATRFKLSRSEYGVVERGKGKKAEVFLVLGEKGIQKVRSQAVSLEGTPMSETLNRIRSGQANRKGWLPAQFNTEILSKSTGQMEPFSLNKAQQTGIRFFKESGAALLNYAPGTGKTLTAIGASTELTAEGKVKKTLVAVPDDKLARQFISDITSMTDATAQKGSASAKTRAKQYQKDSQFTVITHSQLERDAPILKKAGFDMVTVDEIHAMTKKQMAALQSVGGKYRMALTGTPIKTSVTDIYDTLKWLKPGSVPTRAEFDGRFKDITKASSVYEKSVLRDLRDTIKSVTLTRESETPGKKLQLFHPVQLSTEQRARAVLIEQAAIDAQASGTSKAVAEAQRDRALKKLVNSGSAETNAKSKALNGIIRENPTEKILVFVSDNAGLRTVQESLGDSALYLYNGKGLPASQRPAVLAEFKDSPSKNVLVLTDRAGATGLNLEFSNLTVHWDLPSQQYILEQREARNWRGKKATDVRQFYLTTDTTYDFRLRKALESMQKTMGSLAKAEQLDQVGVARTISLAMRKAERDARVSGLKGPSGTKR